MKKSRKQQNPGLSPESTALPGKTQTEAFLETLLARINLDGRQEAAMKADFVKAIRYYENQGLSPDEIRKRLDPANLGYFYYEEPDAWYRLDNAAKIYPVSMRRTWLPMFRLSAYLKEDVIPEIVQIALTFTIRRFPYFAVTMKRGFFWDYMEETRRRFIAKEESRRPFSVMNLSRRDTPCFRVIYYKKRISVEFFHILTDGSGGLVFLKTLVAEYLRLLGVRIPASHGIPDLNEAPDSAEWSNDFHLAPKVKPSSFAGARALQIAGSILRTQPYQILHFILDADRLHQAAKDKGVTVTALVLTYLFFACKASVRPSGKRKIQIQVPCNMRKYFPASRTLRNFSMYCILCFAPDDLTGFDDALQRISEELKAGSSKDALVHQMTAALKLVNSVKFIPLALKASLGQLFYPFFSDLLLTTTFSNLGRVDLPEEMAPYIEQFDFILGTTLQNRVNCSLITHENKAVLSLMKATDNPAFEERLRELLARDGFEITVTGSESHGFHHSISED